MFNFGSVKKLLYKGTTYGDYPLVKSSCGDYDPNTVNIASEYLNVRLYNEYMETHLNTIEVALSEIFDEEPIDLSTVCKVTILKSPTEPLRVNGRVKFSKTCDCNSLNTIISCNMFHVPNGFNRFEFIDSKVYILKGNTIVKHIVDSNIKIHNANVLILRKSDVNLKIVEMFPNIYGLEAGSFSYCYNLPSEVKNNLLYIDTNNQKPFIVVNTLHHLYNDNDLMKKFQATRAESPLGAFWAYYNNHYKATENIMKPKKLGFHANMDNGPLIKNANY